MDDTTPPVTFDCIEQVWISNGEGDAIELLDPELRDALPADVRVQWSSSGVFRLDE